MTFLDEGDEGMWIGTDGYGLNYWNRKENKFDHYLVTSSQKNINKGYSILTTKKGSNGKIWVGTWGNGLIEFDPKTKKYKSYTVEEKENSIASNMVFDIEENPRKKGEYWLTVWRNGICRFDTNTGKFYKYTTTAECSYLGSTVAGKLYYDMLFDHEGNLWIVGDEGVEKVKINEDYSLEIEHYRNDESQYVLSDNMASSVYEDSKNNIWITTNNGLDLYHSKENKFIHFTLQDGFSGNLVNAVLEDDNGNYWVSTENGISKLSFEGNPILKNVTIQYFPQTGVHLGAFNRKAGYKNSKGEIFFGGVDGYNYFDPDSIQKLSITPKVYLNGFKLFNKYITPKDQSGVLEMPIQNTEHITLSHHQSVFTIEYTGIFYTQPESNRYAFKLHGFEKEWNYVGNQRFATYTSLPPGEYTFLVKSANKDGIWNETPSELKITILPPWWDTVLFKIILVLCLLSAIALLFRLRVGALKEQKLRLQFLVKEKTKEIVNKNVDLEEANHELNATIEELAVINDKLKNHQDALEQAYEEVKVQNLNINSSLNYAKNIQHAMLRSDLFIKRLFPDSFIFFKPQNVVSGDFYWFKKLSENDIAIAACDCTGHGVPGALISMLGMNILNQIAMLGITAPHLIMNKLNERILDSLDNKDRNGRDGMDAALIVINKGERKIRFSGAKNPLILIRNGELEVYKGDRISIGGTIEADRYKSQEFTQQEISYEKDEQVTCYLFSDGFQDQFVEKKIKSLW